MGQGVYDLMESMFWLAHNDLVRAANRAAEKPRGRFPDAYNAMVWVFSHEVDYLFSFTRVCEELGLNPDAVRSRWFKDGLFDWESKRPDLVVLTAKGFCRHYKRKPSKYAHLSAKAA